MRKLFKLNNSGFTLIEVIVTLAIAVTVMAAIGTFLVRNLHYNNMAQDEVFIQDQVRYAIKGMTKLVMEKKAVVILTPSGVPSAATSGEGARFNSGIAGELDITWNSGTKEIKYDNGTNEVVLAKNITNFLVVKNADNLITVTIEGTKRKAKFEAVEKIHLRNRL